MSDRLLHQYRQYLNWTEKKIQRYLLVHRSTDEAQLVLALSLALLSHRIPHYGRCSALLEDPFKILEYVIQTCEIEGVFEQDKTSVVSILCSICDDCLEHGVALDSEPLQVLLEGAAKIALKVAVPGMKRVVITRAFEKTLGRPLDWKLVEMMANGKTKSKKKRV